MTTGHSSPATTARIRSLRAKGLSAREISERLGLALQSVRSRLVREGLVKPMNARRLGAGRKSRAIALAESEAGR
jgi:predicted ArsR family transcriptional regulator